MKNHSSARAFAQSTTRAKQLRTMLAAFVVLGASFNVQATPVELVVNGEFELPNIATNSWAAIANASVPGWSSSSGTMEIWGATFNPEGNLAALGSDGLAHGQHHEITYQSRIEYTTQGITIASNGFVDFSFDGWRRDSTGISWNLTGSLSGLLTSGFLALNDNNWHAASVNQLAVLAGEIFTMTFQSVGDPTGGCGTSCGAHIDQVSLRFTAVPEPASLALLGLGLAGLGFSRRKKA